MVTKELLYGVFPDTLTDTEKNYVKSIFSDVKFIHNFKENIKETLYDLCEKEKFSKIIAPREALVLLAAELRDKYGIKGQTLFSAKCFRDKVLMKTALEKSNIRVPKFRLIKNREDIDDYLTKNKNTYPVVIKPTSMSGSRNVTIINSYEGILEWLTKYDFDSNEWEIEEYIAGDFYHVDGLIQDGNVISIWPSKYTRPCAEISYDNVECSYIMSQDSSLIQPLCSFAEKVLQELQIYSEHKLNSAFHMELFYTKNKEIVFCEVGSRIGGCQIHETWIRAFNIDLYEHHVNMSLDYKINLQQPIKPKSLVGTSRVPSKSGTIIKIPSVLYNNATGLDGYICYESIGSIVEPTTKEGALIYLAFTFVSGNDENELLENLENFRKWFHNNTRIL
ncbi:unnamed protein product [Adineta steineri]|uniref:ATP-grasp domain-containing protein n=1 Tax=Adineta steineri TaxID=433720 RepID=A0A818MP00_9BILA|nr:unnamed protein product [Adineta steineri]CAF3592504.1 unnamed protein product [Adineta steineri]